MAGFLGKPQLIVAEEEDSVPRIIKGLPGVEGVAKSYSLPEIRQKLDSLLRHSTESR
jgi:hypothetical protein